MMKFGVAIFSLLLFTFATFAQKPATANEQLAAKYPSLKTQSEALVKALFTDDFPNVVKLTYPRIVAANGGPDTMAAMLKRESDELDKEGYKVQSMAVKEIRQVAEVGDEMFAVVTVTNKIKTPDKKVNGDSYLIGYSDDKGANWTFINGFDQNGFNRVFPQAAGILEIPDLVESR